MLRRALLVVGVLALVSCGGSGGSPGPSPTPQPQANRAPVIASVTVTPAFGVQSFGIYTFNASATDADNDALAYAWDIVGVSRAGSSAQAGPFLNGGNGTATVTVTDGRGGSVAGSVQFIVGTMAGSWTGAITGTSVPIAFAMNLTQTERFVNGTMTINGLSGQVGPTGAPGTIDANGTIELRIKVPPATDAFFHGQLQSTGNRATGTVTGSGFSGQTFVMTK